MTDEDVLVCAGRPIPEYADHIRRYCGLTWSGGGEETWAFRYYEGIPTGESDAIDPIDVVACTALHSGLSQTDLAFFAERGRLLTAWLSELPADRDLADADESTLAHIATLPEVTNEVGLSLLSKVAHRKRPRLIPLFDRAISDLYRLTTRVRGVAGWPDLVRALHQDLDAESNRRVLLQLDSILAAELSCDGPTALRLADIAVWMSSTRS